MNESNDSSFLTFCTTVNTFAMILILPFTFFFQVSLPVVRRFVKSVSEKSVGLGVVRGVRPDQQLVKVSANSFTSTKDFAVYEMYLRKMLRMPQYVPAKEEKRLFYREELESKEVDGRVQVVNDELIGLMGGEMVGIDFAKTGPTVILMAGLQGVGKTTACGKLALYCKKKVTFFFLKLRH